MFVTWCAGQTWPPKSPATKHQRQNRRMRTQFPSGREGGREQHPVPPRNVFEPEAKRRTLHSNETRAEDLCNNMWRNACFFCVEWFVWNQVTTGNKSVLLLVFQPSKKSSQGIASTRFDSIPVWTIVYTRKMTLVMLSYSRCVLCWIDLTAESTKNISHRSSFQ